MNPPRPWWKAPFVVLPVLIVLLVPLYLLGMLLLVLLPLSLAGLALGPERRSLGARSVAADLAVALVAVPVLVLGALAPVRSLLVSALSFFPPLLDKFHEPHAPLYALLEPVFGPVSHGWLDLWWGAFGVVAILAMALLDSIRRDMLVREISILPTSRVRAVAVGVAELAGRAVPLAGGANDRPIVHRWFETKPGGIAERTRADAFHLDDGTGRILVDPAGAKVVASPEAFSVDLHQVRLVPATGANGLPEAKLMPGDPVLVVGSVQINRDPATRATDPVVLRPRRPSLFRLDYYDVFFVGAGTERGLVDRFKQSVHRGWGGVLLLMGATALLPLAAWTNVVQFHHRDPEAAPLALRLVSPPTLMERPLAVAGSGRAPVAVWLRRLGEARDDKGAILAALEPLQLASLAVPALRAAAVDIEHPDFDVAHAWLPRLRRSVPGVWGREYLDPAFADDGRTRVCRVLLVRTGERVRASYDVYLNESEPINAYVSERKVELVFGYRDLGIERTVAIDATAGWNRARGIELPGVFPPGEYTLRVTTRRAFRERRFGAFDRERDPMPEERIAL